MVKPGYVPFGKSYLLSLKDELSGSYLLVNPFTGGSLHQIALSVGGQTTRLLDTYESPDELLQTYDISYKGARLSPFSSIINKGRFSFEGLEHNLPLNWPADGHAIHGFLGKEAFSERIPDQNTPALSFELEFDYPGDYPGYPYPFRVCSAYSLPAPDSFLCHTRVYNTGNTPMPYSEGWHPYFKTHKDSSAFVELSKAQRLVIGEALVPSGLLEPPVPSAFILKLQDEQYDDTFELSPAENGGAISRLVLPAIGKAVLVKQETGWGKYNYLQIYTPPESGSVAIEPMTGKPDAFNAGSMTVIAPGAESHAQFEITLTNYP